MALHSQMIWISDLLNATLSKLEDGYNPRVVSVVLIIWRCKLSTPFWCVKMQSSLLSLAHGFERFCMGSSPLSEGLMFNLSLEDTGLLETRRHKHFFFKPARHKPSQEVEGFKVHLDLMAQDRFPFGNQILRNIPSPWFPARKVPRSAPDLCTFRFQMPPCSGKHKSQKMKQDSFCCKWLSVGSPLLLTPPGVHSQLGHLYFSLPGCYIEVAIANQNTLWNWLGKVTSGFHPYPQKWQFTFWGAVTRSPQQLIFVYLIYFSVRLGSTPISSKGQLGTCFWHLSLDSVGRNRTGSLGSHIFHIVFWEKPQLTSTLTVTSGSGNLGKNTIIAQSFEILLGKEPIETVLDFTMPGFYSHVFVGPVPNSHRPQCFQQIHHDP